MHTTLANYLSHNKRYCAYPKLPTNIFPQQVSESDLKISTHDDLHVFTQYNFGAQKIPHQGFKIHVSTVAQQFQDTLDCVFSYCKAHGYTFKHISNYAYLMRNLCGDDALWSAGKYITIYPPTERDFQRIVQDLYTMPQLAALQGVSIYTDRRFRDSRNLYYRYGVMESGGDLTIYSSNGKAEYQDYQLSTYQLPVGIQEPFPNNYDDTTHASKLFKRYFPIQSLNAKVASLAFIVRDAEQNDKEYVLKSAKSGYGDEEYSLVERLQREERNLRQWQRFAFFPEVIDSFFEDHDYCIVEQKMLGIDIDHYRATFVEQSALRGNPLEDMQRIRNVMLDCLRKIKQLHDAHIQLGDISSANILVDIATDTVSFIDVDQSIEIPNLDDKSSNSTYRTSGFYNASIDYCDYKAQDKHQLGYLFMAMFCRANNYLLIDDTGKQSMQFFKAFAETSQLPWIFVKTVNNLLSHSVSLDSVIAELASETVFAPYHMTKQYEHYSSHQLYRELQQAVFSDVIMGRDVNEASVCMNKVLDSRSFDDMSTLVSLQYELIQENTDAHILVSDKKVQEFLLAQLYELNRRLQTGTDITLKTCITLCIVSLYAIREMPQKAQREKYQYVAEILPLILRVFQTTFGDQRVFCMTPNSDHASPYFSDGVAGVLFILVLLRRWYDSRYQVDLSHELADNLITNIMPQSPTFSWGLSGMLWVLVQLKNLEQTSRYDAYLDKATIWLQQYTMQYEHNRYVINESFKLLDTTFAHGNRGLMLYLESREGK